MSCKENCYCDNDNLLVAMCSNCLFATTEDNAKQNIEANIPKDVFSDENVENMGWGVQLTVPTLKKKVPQKPTKTGKFRLPSYLDQRGENVGFRRERLHPLLPFILPQCHPMHNIMLASLLIRSRKSYTHVITNSLGVVVSVGVFAIMPFPCHRIA